MLSNATQSTQSKAMPWESPTDPICFKNFALRSGGSSAGSVGHLTPTRAAARSHCAGPAVNLHRRQGGQLSGHLPGILAFDLTLVQTTPVFISGVSQLV